MNQRAVIRYETGIRKGQEFTMPVVSYVGRNLVTRDDLREHRWIMMNGVGVHRETMGLRVLRVEAVPSEDQARDGMEGAW